MNLKKILILTLPPILVVISLFTPFWSISMKAPFLQKPLTVEVYPLFGLKGDLKNVNVVNHYVGLGEIDPEHIPELKYIPLVYAGLIVLSVATGLAFNRGRIFYILWGIYVVLLAAVPLYAYVWMYNYTHTINPGAPIEIEPFDPPFFGFHKIANFYITSYLGPAFFLPLAAAIIQIYPRIKRRRRAEKWKEAETR